MDAEREAREALRPRDIPGCGSPAYVFGFDAGWAAASEWCRADQTRRIVTALREWGYTAAAASVATRFIDRESSPLPSSPGRLRRTP